MAILPEAEPTQGVTSMADPDQGNFATLGKKNTFTATFASRRESYHRATPAPAADQLRSWPGRASTAGRADHSPTAVALPGRSERTGALRPTVGLAKDLLGQRQPFPAGREPSIRRDLEQRLDHVLLGCAVVQRHPDVQLQPERPALRRQSCDRHQALGAAIEPR